MDVKGLMHQFLNGFVIDAVVVVEQEVSAIEAAGGVSKLNLSLAPLSNLQPDPIALLTEGERR
jgi:hypothetical protein